MRILVVEDNALIAFDVADALRQVGFEVVGPATTLDEAIDLVDLEAPDGAILDIDMGRSETTFDLARRLVADGKVVMFLTGHSAAVLALPEDLQTVRRFLKPYDRHEVMDEFAKLI